SLQVVLPVLSKAYSMEKFVPGAYVPAPSALRRCALSTCGSGVVVGAGDRVAVGRDAAVGCTAVASGAVGCCIVAVGSVEVFAVGSPPTPSTPGSPSRGPSNI